MAGLVRLGGPGRKGATDRTLYSGTGIAADVVGERGFYDVVFTALRDSDVVSPSVPQALLDTRTIAGVYSSNDAGHHVTARQGGPLVWDGFARC